jgi:hypothetical protein
VVLTVSATGPRRQVHVEEVVVGTVRVTVGTASAPDRSAAALGVARATDASARMSITTRAAQNLSGLGPNSVQSSDRVIEVS